MLPSLIGIIASSGGGVANSYESIATVTVGAGGSSSISFSSISSSYQHLQIRYIARGTAAVSTNNVQMRHNSDTGTNYSWHRIFGNGTTVGAGGSATQSLEIVAQTAGASIASNIFGSGIIDILDYSNTSKYKTSRTLGGIEDNSGTTNSSVQLFSGLWQNTAAISSIQITLDSGNFAQYSSFALYGIKG